MKLSVVSACRIPVLLVALILWTDRVARAVQMQSPDGRLVAEIQLSEMDAAAGNCLTYGVTYDNRVIIEPSRLGLDLTQFSLTEDVRIASARQSSHDSTWKPVCGERSEIRDHYRQLVITQE